MSRYRNVHPTRSTYHTMSSPSLTSSSGSSRLHEWFSTIPLCTAALFVLNVSIHIAIFLTSPNVFEFAIHPGRVWNAHEVFFYIMQYFNCYLILIFPKYYRLITSAFVHGGILHILMNMMSLLQLGATLVLQYMISSSFLTYDDIYVNLGTPIWNLSVSVLYAVGCSIIQLHLCFAKLV